MATISKAQTKGTGTAAPISGGAFTVSLPGAVTAGNVVTIRLSGATTYTATGFTARDSENVGANCAILDRIADGTGGDVTGSYTVNGTTGTNVAWQIDEWKADVAGTWAFDGHSDSQHNTTSPFNVSPGTTTGSDTVTIFATACSSATPTAVVITPPTGGALTLDTNHLAAGARVLSTTHKIVDGATFAYTTTSTAWTGTGGTTATVAAAYAFTPSAGAETGTADLTGTGSLAVADATAETDGSASPTGTGSSTVADATAAATGAAALSGTGSLDATGTFHGNVNGSAALSGAGSLVTAAGTAASVGSADLTGTGDLVVTPPPPASSPDARIELRLLSSGQTEAHIVDRGRTAVCQA